MTMTDIVGYAYNNLFVVLCRHCDAKHTDLHQRTDRQSLSVAESLKIDDWCYECDLQTKHWTRGV